MFILTIFLTFILFSSNSVSSNLVDESLDRVLKDNSASCREKVLELDALIKRILVMDGSDILPTNNTSQQEYCSPLKRLRIISKETIKCTIPFVGQIITIFAAGIKKPVKWICKGPKERVFKNFGCMNKEFIKNLNMVESNFIDALHTLNAPNVTHDELLPGLCCSIHNMLDGFLRIPHAPCSDPKASPSKTFHDRSEEGLTDILNLICGSLPNTKACDKEKYPILETLEKQRTDLRNMSKEPFAILLFSVVSKLAVET